MSGTTPSTVARAIRFVLIAGTATVADVAVLVLLRHGLDAPLVLAVAGGWCTSLAVGYLLNRRVVFADGKHSVQRSSVRYFALTGVNAAVGILGVAALVDQGVNYLVARISASALMVVVNFVVCRIWVFGVPEAAAEAKP